MLHLSRRKICSDNRSHLNIVPLACEKVSNIARIATCLPLMLCDGAGDNGGQYSEYGTARAFFQSRKFRNRYGDSILVLTAHQLREHLRSVIKERGLLARGKDAGKALKHAGLLHCGVGKLLRAIRLQGGIAECRQ